MVGQVETEILETKQSKGLKTDKFTTIKTTKVIPIHKSSKPVDSSDSYRFRTLILSPVVA